MNFYTADTHFRHANILKYCPNRKFKNIAEHDVKLTQNWNAVVKVEDHVYIMGDFAFADIATIKSILSKLNGIKHLIIGNHDKHPWDQYIEAGFTTVQRYQFINIKGVGPVGLAHDPSVCITAPSVPWFVGHLHQQFLRMGNAINVGVDVRGFAPVSEENLMDDLRITIQCHMKMDPFVKELTGIE